MSALLRRSAAPAAVLALLSPVLATAQPATGVPASRQAEAAPRVAERAWWQAFGDPVLNALVTRALADGPDLAAAVARVDQAQAAARAAGAGRLPIGEVNGTLARSEQSLRSGLGQLSRYVPTIERTQDMASLHATLGWDLDLGGGLRGNARAARADVVAAGASLGATRLALASEVVSQYLALREAEALARLLGEQRDDLQTRLGHAMSRVAAGDAPAREQDDRKRDRAAIDADLALVDAQAVAARNALAVLTGRAAGSSPPELEGPPGASGAIPLAEDPAAITPADLLRARPDLIVAEARIVGAKARVKTALGEYWPHVSIGGLLGFETNALASFGAGSTRTTQGFLGLRWRLFDFARINAEVAAARGEEREALAAYRDAVLRAGEQVETAFTLAAARRTALAAQEQRLAVAEQAWRRAQAAYRLGEISGDQLRGEHLLYVQILAQRITARRALAEAILACHRALGG